MDALLNIFSIRFTFGVKRRRRYLIYFAIAALITEPFDINTNIINKKEVIEKIKSKIDVVYKDVKKMKYHLKQTTCLMEPQPQSNLDKNHREIRKTK